MPDLGNLSFSASLTLTRCPSFKSLTDPHSPDPTSSPFPNSVTAIGTIEIEGEVRNGGTGIRVWKRSRPGFPRTKKASNAKSLEDHVKDWASRSKKSGVPESRCSLPFLVGAKKMVFIHTYIYKNIYKFCLALLLDFSFLVAEKN